MKSIKLLGILSIAVLSLQACNKKDTTTPTPEITTSVQAIDAVVDQNGTYRLILPSSASGYTVSSDALHASSSKIVTDNGIEAYEYVPAADYLGSDELVLIASDTVTDGEHHGGCKGGNKMPPPPAGALKPGQDKMRIHQQEIHLNISVTSPSIPS